MQKVIYITDPHISGKNPICRLDDLTTTQFIKLRKVIKKSNELGIPIINGGDLTDSPNISYSTYTKLANILKQCKHGFYTVYGNHDLQYHTLETTDSVALGALIESVPTIKHISEFEFDYDIPIDYEDWDNEKLIIHNKANILICHRAIITNFMVDSSWKKDNNIDFYNINNKGLSKYGLILCGHFHKQYRIIKNGKIVLNPGCLTRRKSNDIEIHKPSYYIVNLKTFDYKLHEIEGIKETDEVVSDSHLTYSKMVKNIKGEISEFFKKLKINKDKNQFFITLMKMFNDLEENSFKETMREILILTYGSRMNGFERPTKFKRHSLQN